MNRCLSRSPYWFSAPPFVSCGIISTNCAGYDAHDADRLNALSVTLAGLPLAPDFLERKYLPLTDVRAMGGMGDHIFVAFGIEAVAFLLLERADRVLGALQLSWCGTPFPEFPAAPVAEVVRAYVGLAVDIHARTDEAVQTATTLSDTEMLLTTIHDPDELLDAMAAKITAAVGCDWGSVHLLDEVSGRFCYTGGAGSVTVTSTEPRIGVSHEEVAQALARFGENDVIEIPDAAATEELQPYRARAEIASFVMLPLRRGDAFVGLVTLGYHHRKGRFARRQITLAKGLAHHALAALESARLVRSLTQASQTKDDFVAAVSHDLRTPLHILIGYNDMLLDGGAGPLGDQQRDLVARVRECAVRFLDLIDGILEIARLDAGQASANPAPIALEELCAALAREIDGLRRPGIELRWDVEASVVRGDAPKIKMILRNLLTNALKFTAAGHVELRCLTTPAGEVVFRVADTGPGVSSTDRADIFQMFHQGDAGRRVGGSGLGLGLYLVQRLTHVLGGTVELVSGEPGNTVFEVRLPQPPG